MRPERTFLYKLMLSVVRAALAVGFLLVVGIVFVLVGISRNNPENMELTEFKLQRVSEVYVRNRTHSPLTVTVRMRKDYLPFWMERLRRMSPSLHKAADTHPVVGQADLVDAVQAVASDSSILLARRETGYHHNSDGNEPVMQRYEWIYQPGEVVNGPHPFTLRPTVQWVDGQHHTHTQRLTLAEIDRDLVSDSVAGPVQRPKVVRYLDYR